MKVKLLKRLRKRFIINKEYCITSDEYLYMLRDTNYFEDYNQNYELIKSSNTLQKVINKRRKLILKEARTNYSKIIKII